MNGGAPAALILAGSRAAADPVAAAGGRSCKAFVPVAGQPMLARVIEALEASGRVGRVTVVLDAAAPLESEAPALAARMADGGIDRIDPGPTPSQSVLRAFDVMPPGRPLLVTTADHPLLTADMVRDFIDDALASEADACAGLAPTALIDAAYPQVRRTRIRFRDGGRSGCNLFLFRGRRARNVLTFWGRMEARRKRPWRLAFALGPVTLAAYALGLLGLDDALRRLGRKADARLHAVTMQQPEAAIDVDTVDDLRLVETILSCRSCRGAGETSA